MSRIDQLKYQMIDRPRFREIEKHIFEVVGKLKVQISDVTPEPVKFEDRLSLRYVPIEAGKEWGKDFECAWFRFQGEIPKNSCGKMVLLIDLGGEGCVYSADGVPEKGLTNKDGGTYGIANNGKKVVYLENNTSKIELWVDGAANSLFGEGKAKLAEASIAVFHEDAYQFYYDYTVIAESISFRKHDDPWRRQAASAAKMAYKLAAQGNYAEGSALIAPLFVCGKALPLKVTAIGHAHLDLAWLWPVRETKRKAARTFATALKNIEKYPEYVIGISQPQQFQWMKEEYPELYTKIKAAVFAHRIEPQGGFWVETDTNITGGESLVRQAIYGQRFMREEFGQTMEICWLPDVFGGSGQIPQIAKKSGMKYFTGLRFTYNEHNPFKKRAFVWEGIDGSRLIVQVPPDHTYNSQTNAKTMFRLNARYPERDRTDRALLLYGIGDGGGGPGEGHIQYLMRQKALNGQPQIKMGRAIDFYKEYEKDVEKFDTVKGEMYLERHQGTLTTQGNIKRLNRITETALHNLDAVLSAAVCKGYQYNKTALDRVWQEILLYDFHDILPGSSIGRVYAEITPRYNILLEEIKTMTEAALAFLAGNKKETSYYNFTQYERVETIDGAVLYAKPFAKATAADNGLIKAAVSGLTLENAFLKAEFSSSGALISLLDKKSGKEALSEPSNLFPVYHDVPKEHDAWNLDINYPQLQRGRFELVSQRTLTQGKSAVMKQCYRYRDSTLRQTIILSPHQKYLKFDTKVHWAESHKMLRAQFFTSVKAEKALYDIQFGNIFRTTKDSDKISSAQLEVAAHKWADVSDGSFGLALLNDCKYGHRIKNQEISLNLLRSPKYPDKNADMGDHHFAYALYPHGGSAYEGEVHKEAMLFNHPLVKSNYAADILPLEIMKPCGVVLETVKPAESGAGIVIRLYENEGRHETVGLQAGFAYQEAYETDLLENVIAKADVKKLVFTPYEIKTVVFTL